MLYMTCKSSLDWNHPVFICYSFYWSVKTGQLKIAVCNFLVPCYCGSCIMVKDNILIDTGHSFINFIQESKNKHFKLSKYYYWWMVKESEDWGKMGKERIPLNIGPSTWPGVALSLEVGSGVRGSVLKAVIVLSVNCTTTCTSASTPSSCVTWGQQISDLV